jgi:TatD DNase family protein
LIFSGFSTYGLWFSVNHAMTQSANGRAILSELPPDQVLTETDGPFLKVSGRAQTPPDVAAVLPALATLWKVHQREARRIVAENFERLLHPTASHV